MIVRIRAGVLACFAMLALQCLPALAWDAVGHREVGAVADHLLSGTRAGREVRQILGGWTLQQGAVWADCAKGVTSSDDHAFSYAADPLKFPDCSPFGSAGEIDRMTDFVRRNWKQCGSAHDGEYCHNQYHYADVATFRDRYQLGETGTSKHDVVHAITAAIAVLQDQASSGPVSIIDKREALMLLAHYVGDVHQPLHVVAIYLDAKGTHVDPDRSGYQVTQDTAGGNRLQDHLHSLHFEWDTAPGELMAGGKPSEALLRAARETPATAGDLETWSSQCATDTLLAGRETAFAGLQFHLNPATSPGGKPAGWTLDGADAQYVHDAEALKTRQIAKAGARLAQLIEAIWPEVPPLTGGECSPDPAPSKPGYIALDTLAHLTLWLPEAPAVGSAGDALDLAAFADTRPLLNTPRGQQAALDDVYEPEALAGRFGLVLGKTLTLQTAPTLMRLIGKLEQDGGNWVAPIKRKLCAGGRVRPFVRVPDARSCLFPMDLANRRDNDIGTFTLDTTGSYPSTHALIGMLVGLTLSEIVPDHADRLLQWGMEFGQSRVICGFHYASDVQAGRLVAAALLPRLHATRAFQEDLRQVKKEIAAAK